MFEILTFRLRADTDEDTFRALDERIQTEFAYHQPGCLRRTLGRHEDGRWLALTVWADAASASAARTAFEESDLGAEFATSTIEVVVEHFHGVD